MIKQKIGNKEFSLKFTNRSFINLDEKYNNAGDIFNGILTGDKHLKNSIKIVSVSYKEDIDENWILDNATPEQFLEMSNVANELIFEYLGIKPQQEAATPQQIQDKKK